MSFCCQLLGRQWRPFWRGVPQMDSEWWDEKKNCPWTVCLLNEPHDKWFVREMSVWWYESQKTKSQRCSTPLLLETSHQKTVLGLKISWISKFDFEITISLSFCLSPLLMCVLKCLQNISLKGAFTSDVVLNTKLRLFEDTSWQIGTIYADKLCRILQRNCRNWEDKYTKKRDPDNCLLTQVDKLCKGLPGPHTLST